MMKKKNTGVSMVEILIALAVFMLLMIPIVSGIISSMKMTTSGKELQLRNDFAENLMEHIKTVNISEIQDPAFYNNLGSSDFNGGTKTVTQVTGEDKYKTNFIMEGTVKLGTENKQYAYKIVVDNSDYVDNASFDPNNMALGIVEDIDYEKVALIDGTMVNYDTRAYDFFYAKKLLRLKEIDETGYNQQIQQPDVDLFKDDLCSRMMTIEVSGSQKTGYTVRCVLDYIDKSRYLDSSNNHVQYVPYAKTFSTAYDAEANATFAKLPNIYVMYNPTFYNSNYMPADYVRVDTSGLTDPVYVTNNGSKSYATADLIANGNGGAVEIQDVNVFLIETAEKYSQTIKDAYVSAESSFAYSTANGTIVYPDYGSDEILYNTNYTNQGMRERTVVYLMASQRADMINESNRDYNSYLDRIHVYTNIGDNYDKQNGKRIDDQENANPDDWTVLRNRKTDNAHFVTSFAYSSGSLVSQGDMDALRSLSDADRAITAIKFENILHLNYLDEATVESRGLYNVKIYMEEGSSVSAGAVPILEATKAGNETNTMIPISSESSSGEGGN